MLCQYLTEAVGQKREMVSSGWKVCCKNNSTLIAFICITMNLEMVIVTVCLRNIISLDISYRERDMIYYIFNLLHKQSGKITSEGWPSTSIQLSHQSKQPNLYPGFFVMGLLIMD